MPIKLGLRVNQEEVQRMRVGCFKYLLVGLGFFVSHLFGQMRGALSASAGGQESCSPPADAGWGQLQPGFYRRDGTEERTYLACGWGGPDPEEEQTSSTHTGELSPIFTSEVRKWERLITTWSRAAGLDPNLVATVMQVESCGGLFAVSRSGAIGLFQVMPNHFVDGEVAFNPTNNSARGLEYLATGFELAQGDIGRTAAGYNGGHSRIPLPETRWFDETIRYRNWVVGIFNDATSGVEHSSTLEEWLQAGGSSLCQKAAQQLAALP